jgi:hypothetical protein
VKDFTQASVFLYAIDHFVMAITSAEAAVSHAPFTSPGNPPGPTRGEIDHDGYDHIRPVRGCTRVAGINRGANEPRAKRSVNWRETPGCDGYISGFPKSLDGRRREKSSSVLGITFLKGRNAASRNLIHIRRGIVSDLGHITS